jgi:hypothetical protein
MEDFWTYTQSRAAPGLGPPLPGIELAVEFSAPLRQYSGRWIKQLAPCCGRILVGSVHFSVVKQRCPFLRDLLPSLPRNSDVVNAASLSTVAHRTFATVLIAFASFTSLEMKMRGRDEVAGLTGEVENENHRLSQRSDSQVSPSLDGDYLNGPTNY